MNTLEKILNEIKASSVYGETKDGYGASIIPIGVVGRIISKHMKNDGWIPVEERLPEDGQEVLCCDDKEVYFVEYQADCDAPFGYMDGIIAWQPQPEPYKPERSRMKREIERRYNPEYCEQCGYILPQCKCGKDDASKPILSRVPPGIILAIEKVREYGCRKYPEDSWRDVELQRYWEATLRHALEAWNDYRAVDPESGLPHLWHMACNLAFIIEKEKEAE